MMTGGWFGDDGTVCNDPAPTLTFEKLKAAMDQMRATMPRPIGGPLRIIRNHFHPRELVAHEVYSYLPHSFWRWLWRTALRREHPPSMERGHPIYQDGPMVKMGDAIYCSPRQANELEAAIRRAR